MEEIFTDFIFSNIEDNKKNEVNFTKINDDNFKFLRDYLENLNLKKVSDENLNFYKIDKIISSEDFDIEIIIKINKETKKDSNFKKIIYYFEDSQITFIESEEIKKISFTVDNINLIIRFYKIFKNTNELYSNKQLSNLINYEFKTCIEFKKEDINFKNFFDDNKYSVSKYIEDKYILAFLFDGIWIYKPNKMYNYFCKSKGKIFERFDGTFFEICKDSDKYFVLDCIQFKENYDKKIFKNLYARLQIFQEIQKHINFCSLNIDIMEYLIISSPEDYFGYMEYYYLLGFTKVMLSPSLFDKCYFLQLDKDTIGESNYLFDKFTNLIINKYIKNYITYDDFFISYKPLPIIYYNLEDKNMLKEIERISNFFNHKIYYTTSHKTLTNRNEVIKFEDEPMIKRRDKFYLMLINPTENSDIETFADYVYSSQKFTSISTIGDGSCMIHSILKCSCQLYQNFNGIKFRTNLAQLFRNEMANRLEEEFVVDGKKIRYYYLYANGFFNSIEFTDTDRDIKNYNFDKIIKRIRKISEYLGDDVLLLCSEIIKMNILIVKKNGNKLKYVNYVSNDYENTIIILYINDNHYESISIKGMTIFKSNGDIINDFLIFR